MDTILTNATDEQLCAAVEENLYALFRAMAAALPDAEIAESERLGYHIAFPTNPMFKGVWRTRLSDAEADKTIDETVAHFKARGAPFMFWWTGNDTTPRDLGTRLEARGFSANVINDPGMVADLHALKEDFSTPPNFRIEEATEQKALEQWRDVFCAVYEVPAFAGQAWVDATLRVGAANAPWKLYIGYLGDEPVATNILFHGGGVASVYGVGTLASARRQGIGAAITLKPLLDARTQGYRYAVLYATEPGVPTYEYLGFRLCEARVSRYMWVNPG